MIRSLRSVSSFYLKNGPATYKVAQGARIMLQRATGTIDNSFSSKKEKCSSEEEMLQAFKA